jgi:hypothetical protein
LARIQGRGHRACSGQARVAACRLVEEIAERLNSLDAYFPAHRRVDEEQ